MRVKGYSILLGVPATSPHLIRFSRLATDGARGRKSMIEGAEVVVLPEMDIPPHIEVPADPLRSFFLVQARTQGLTQVLQALFPDFTVREV